MPGGVVFLVCIPTLSYEHELVFGVPVKSSSNKRSEKSTRSGHPAKVDLRLKEVKSRTHLITLDDDESNDEVSDNEAIERSTRGRLRPHGDFPTGLANRAKSPVFVPMETVLDELLKKLRIEHIVWCKDRANMYYEVIFPVAAGDSCENCLHCLTEMGIGTRMNSIVSVIPTQCTYSGLRSIGSSAIRDDIAQRKKDAEERNNNWEAFVDSIRSKLTVKQVVDGVRSGGDLTFDYVLLVLTADCLAALGLVENSATNVVAAMLVSPLMVKQLVNNLNTDKSFCVYHLDTYNANSNDLRSGKRKDHRIVHSSTGTCHSTANKRGPVMSLTFGTIIADRELQYVGLKSLMLGIFLSILFGFIFGLILGTTEMPWGYNDWPTDEMKGRGNYRSLWMGVLWALPSGTGVAVALLQGSNGPLIGVAISASLLPPVVNCGLFWALGCIWLIYRPIKMPHIKGESYANFNSSYVYVYTDYLPVEFFCNGIISACLTFINVMCIFITAIIVLKIKEVAAPYTSTPELRRFWERDIRLVRDKNNSRANSSIDSSFYDGLSKMKQRALERTLNEAVREAMNDETFRKVQRSSYGQRGPDEIAPRLGFDGGVTGVGDSSRKDDTASRNREGVVGGPTDAAISAESTSEDLAALDRLITYLLAQPSGNLESWRRSKRASARGYRQLRPNVEGGATAPVIGTTPL